MTVKINHPPVWTQEIDAKDLGKLLPPNPTKKYKFIKAGSNGLLVELLVDASGSMTRTKHQTRIGINAFLDEQAKADTTFVTLRTFATPMGQERHVTHFRHVKSSEAGRISDEDYVTAGDTPLYDAVGMAIMETNEFLKKLPKKERPGILINIVTDGLNNRSHRYNLNDIRTMINEATDANWSFTFIGANINAREVGVEMGIMAQNTMAFDNVAAAPMMAGLAASTTRYGKALRASSGGFNARDYASSGAMYTSDERLRSVSGKHTGDTTLADVKEEAKLYTSNIGKAPILRRTYGTAKPTK